MKFVSACFCAGLAVALCAHEALAVLPFGASADDQSAFALGSLSLNVIFVESDGSIDSNLEDWSEDQLTNSRSHIETAAQFWEDQTSSFHPGARLSIDVDYINGGVPLNTGYEPITRPSGEQDFWTEQIMNNLGYAEADPPSTLRAFNQAQRLANDTHWAATLFVVNDQNDADHRFADGNFAYSSNGGPSTTLTYNNNGWGVSRLNQVVTHELGHAFWALDEYYGAGLDTEVRTGYLNAPNSNSERAPNGTQIDPPQPNSLMLNLVLSLSDATRAQIGWTDTDGDTIPDILDTLPILTGNDTASDPATGLFSFAGSAMVTTLDNQNPYAGDNDMTINTIMSAEFNLDGLGWQVLAAADGAFGGYMESLSLDLLALAAGNHTIDIRAYNSVGNLTNELNFQFLSLVPEPSSGTLFALASATVAISLAVRRRRRDAAERASLAAG